MGSGSYLRLAVAAEVGDCAVTAHEVRSRGRVPWACAWRVSGV